MCVTLRADTMPHPPEDESQSEIERQIAALIAAGHRREDLWVSASGRVLVDQDAGALAAHLAIFHPDAKPEEPIPPSPDSQHHPPGAGDVS